MAVRQKTNKVTHLANAKASETSFNLHHNFLDQPQMDRGFTRDRVTQENSQGWLHRHADRYTFNPALDLTEDAIQVTFGAMKDIRAEVDAEAGRCLSDTLLALASEGGFRREDKQNFTSWAECGRDIKKRLKNDATLYADVSVNPGTSGAAISSQSHHRHFLLCILVRVRSLN